MRRRVWGGLPLGKAPSPPQRRPDVADGEWFVLQMGWFVDAGGGSGAAT